MTASAGLTGVIRLRGFGLEAPSALHGVEVGLMMGECLAHKCHYGPSRYVSQLQRLCVWPDHVVEEQQRSFRLR